MGNEKVKTSFHHVWEVLMPFLLYYIVYNAAFIVLAFLLQVGMEHFGEDFQDFMLQNAQTVNGIVGGFSMIAGILPLTGMLRRELSVRSQGNEKKGMQGRLRWTEILLVIALAVASSLGLNVLLSLTGAVNSSAAFREISDRQFGVVFGVGIILYGVLSPLAEEVVFRGLMYNRMRKMFPLPLAVAVSGFLFGCYHGNLVQGIYGTCMGILIAYVYERFGSFLAPVLFHAAANIAVYVVGNYAAAHDLIFRPGVCAALLAFSAAGIVLCRRNYRIDK